MKSKSYIGNRYNRVKLYKKGKFWVASSITFLALGIGAEVTTVHAANVSVAMKKLKRYLLQEHQRLVPVHCLQFICNRNQLQVQ